MKIQQGQFNLRSSHEAIQRLTKEESLQIVKRTDGKDQVLTYQNKTDATQVSLSYYGSANTASQGAAGDDTYDRFPVPGRQADAQEQAPSDSVGTNAPSVSTDPLDNGLAMDAEAIADLRMLAFVQLMEQMFGLRISLDDSHLSEEDLKDIQKLRGLGEQMDAMKPANQRAASGQNTVPSNGQQITYSATTFYHEEEHTHMEAKGKVITEDGRELELSLDLNMSRSFQSESFVQFSEGNLKDPLVINFDRPSVGLSDKLHFQFDLDADGEDETLPELLAGSGYLALDLNGDGVINSGNELFGAQSGDGFEELAQYDDDGNGFIDENDAVFSQLKIWVPKGEGESELYALLDKDVGAIYLKSEQTPFALKTETGNRTQGYVRESGVFLKESGGIASVQQIDLKV
ncbi:hypothetical protein [Oceanospirillum linum]|uniref:EF-hand domain-containing protein n=1 Tax=Oceanospirillum linum TaxID=966 RepID=A0A1T1HAG7_OCELI|nr:hypothetical protein [Oceanospirillum linum]OOV86823.1 hypothetical protein BTA35_0211020 [Oceanospirillum linum]SEG21432.1 hypothetical protein SAMN04489856_106133 [Oleiphilus messinensis]SMP25035.1 hypothetical protein SAMN06264348_105132 [Oceanospirillum linum]